MSIWTAVQYVTGVFTLVAFGIAAMVVVRFREIRREELSISRAAPEQLLGVLDRLARKYHVDTTSLTRTQKLSVIEGQHRHDLDNLKLRLRYGLAALALLVLATAFSAFKAQLPPAQRAEATGEVKLNLEPQGSEITANLKATTVAHISEKGWAALSVFVNNEKEPCNVEKAYWNWSNKSPYHDLEVNCTVTVMAHRPYLFRALHENWNADAQTIVLAVTYSR